MSQPIVSVLSLVYNQVRYVEDMLKGFLKQKTDFEVEYIIHDDASSDGTQDILKEYEKQYPDKFQIVYEMENQWSKGVKIVQKILLPQAKGKYIAFCEGDDFWIDQNKLQKQKDFLDAHTDYVCVAHNALLWHCRENYLEAQNNYDTSRELGARDIIDRRYPSIATASRMYRKEALNLEPLFLECGEVGDMPTDFFAFTKGKFYYMDVIMSVYRYESEGSWSQRLNGDIKRLITWRGIALNFLDKYNIYTKGNYEFYVRLYMTRAVQNIVDKLIQLEIPKERFVSLIKQVKEDTEHRYDVHFEEISRIVDIMVYGYESNFQKELESLSDTKIYIYGAGKYGKIMANYFIKNNMNFEGFVVADVTANPLKIEDKKIYGIEEYICLRDKATLVVALGSTYWEEVFQTFQKYGIGNYIYPIFANITPIDKEGL